MLGLAVQVQNGLVEKLKQRRVGAFFFQRFVKNFTHEQRNAGFDKVVGHVGERLAAFDLRKAHDAAAFPVVNYQVEQGQWLEEGNLVLAFGSAYTVFDVRLKAKLLGVNFGDDGSFPETNIIDDNAAGFKKHTQVANRKNIPRRRGFSLDKDTIFWSGMEVDSMEFPECLTVQGEQKSIKVALCYLLKSRPVASRQSPKSGEISDCDYSITAILATYFSEPSSLEAKIR